jgi:hypothetical protein
LFQALHRETQSLELGIVRLIAISDSASMSYVEQSEKQVDCSANANRRMNGDWPAVTDCGVRSKWGNIAVKVWNWVGKTGPRIQKGSQCV